MTKIVLFGTGKSAIDAYKFLVSKNIQVLPIWDPADKGEDTHKPSFGKFLKQEKITHLKPKSFQENEFINKLVGFKPNIILSMQCAQIIKDPIINITNGEIFNIHFSDLPKNRGVYPIYWHIKNGDKYAGVTLHKLDKGVDTGDIIDQIRKPINFKDSARNIYNWAEDAAIILLKNNLANLLDKSYKSIKQDNSKASYHSRYSVNFSFAFINWDKTSFEVARLIQSLNFPPLQRPATRFRNYVLQVLSVEEVQKSKVVSLPGTVLNVGTDQIVKVQTADGFIAIKTEGVILKKGDLLYI